MALTDSNTHEGLKATVHGGVLALALVCGGYNLVAWVRRREGHLLTNTVIYGGLVLLETKKIAHHLYSSKSSK